MNKIDIEEIKFIQQRMTDERNKREGIGGEKAKELMHLLDCAKVLGQSVIIAERLFSKKVESYHYIGYINGRHRARYDHNRRIYRTVGAFMFNYGMTYGTRRKHAA